MGGDGHPVDVGSYDAMDGDFVSDSPYGTFDQAGNVWEWNEAWIDPDRGLRGGAYYSTDDRLLASRRDSCNPANGRDYFGFRVSAVPEPATLALLGLGGVATLLGRKRRR